MCDTNKEDQSQRYSYTLLTSLTYYAVYPLALSTTPIVI